ncbi:hypothetical protein BRADI_1g31611v3 [Brachypodium distachyon]|uniref:Uncharacterized protein n=1 Tax=Brachypodium distachyon TaxID=15368 RepID=A0A0Q3JY39_BRADI|nr:hypothetical protein BRADI_1g31611v3 [Brachypodium distachyon]
MFPSGRRGLPWLAGLGLYAVALGAAPVRAPGVQRDGLSLPDPGAAAGARGRIHEPQPVRVHALRPLLGAPRQVPQRFVETHGWHISKGSVPLLAARRRCHHGGPLHPLAVLLLGEPACTDSPFSFSRRRFSCRASATRRGV